jgi:PAS domain S-box-containing protein
MRDEHRPKQELVHEIAGLRKQVVDLKDAMTARRRVEDALRDAAALLRSLIDSAPIGLCLFRRDGTLLTANRPFARMLGYDSPAELQALGGVLGIFADPEERCRAFESSEAPGQFHHASFRRKDGYSRLHRTIAADCATQGTVTLAVFDRLPDNKPLFQPLPRSSGP